MDYSLSNHDIYTLLNRKVPTLTYSQLEEIPNLDFLFNFTDEILLLYPSREIQDNEIVYNPNVGHWTALTKDKDTITFFDSYGSFPDYQITTKDFDPVLTKLLLDYQENHPNVNLQYNDRHLQKLKPNIATCGRHTALWLNNYKKYNIDDYSNTLKDSNLDLDEFVTELTDEIYSRNNI
jgi:hypothetical protein